MAMRDSFVLLDSGGRRLWAEVTASWELDEAGLVVLEEACRVKDRLDRMSALMDRDDSAWLSVLTDAHGDYELVIDSLFSEARHYANVLKGLIGELRQLGKRRTVADAGGFGDLAGRIADRRAQTAPTS